MKVAVIGAGPGGLAAAYELARAGVEVDVYERDHEVGGLARSLRLWEQPVKLEPHFMDEGAAPEVPAALDAKAIGSSACCRMAPSGAMTTCCAALPRQHSLPRCPDCPARRPTSSEGSSSVS